MPSDLLRALRIRLEEEIDGLALTDERLEAVIDARFGEVVLRIDHDEEAASIRAAVAVPPPAGAGPDFLLWCLAINTQYWDVKIGLDDTGELLVHADLDADETIDIGDLASGLIDRVETILDLLDDDLTEWVLAHGLGTPPQRARWQSRAKAQAE